MTLRGLPGLILLAAIVLLAVPSAVGYYTDWLWFQELGYGGIFLRRLNTQGLVFAITFFAVFGFLYFNFRIARRMLGRPLIVGRSPDGRPITVEGRQLGNLAMPVSTVLALSMAITGAASWMEWLAFFNAVPFDTRDPIFGRDDRR